MHGHRIIVWHVHAALWDCILANVALIVNDDVVDALGVLVEEFIPLLLCCRREELRLQLEDHLHVLADEVKVKARHVLIVQATGERSKSRQARGRNPAHSARKKKFVLRAQNEALETPPRSAQGE